MLKQKPVTLRVQQIHPNPKQPRRRFDPERLQSLAATIRELGLIQPLIVMPDKTGYMLLAGERRWRAAQIAGCQKLPCIIRSSADTDPATVMVLALIENSERVDLNPIEEARAYEYLHKEMGLSIEEIAAKVKPGLLHGRAHVEARLIWLKLEPEIQDLVEDTRLPRDRRAAEALLNVTDKDTRIKLARRLAAEKAKISTIEHACTKMTARLADKRTQKSKCPMQLKAREKAGHDLPVAAIVQANNLQAAAQAMCAACEIRSNVLHGRIGQPAWQLIVAGAGQVCADCGGRELVGTCNGCPGVELLRRVVQLQTQGDDHVHRD